MTTETQTEAAIPTPGTEELPVPHRCPWIMQYVLASPLRRLVEPAHKLIGPFVEPGMTVVEPGCGFGYFTVPLAERVGPEGHVIALDVEPRAIARVERRARRAGLTERIEARTCEATDLGLTDLEGQVDRVVVVHTLHEFEDLPGFLRQARRLLALEGRIVVVEPRGHVKPAQFEAMMAICAEQGLVEVERPDLGSKRLAALLGQA